MTNQQPTQPQTLYDQRGQKVYGGQTNVAGDQHIHLPSIEPTAAMAPAPPKDFVGREAQLTQLTATLCAGKSAAITALHGMGGIGKTALAQQLAERLKPTFPGGIFWGDLALHGGSAETILRAWGAICGADFSQEPDPAVLSGRLRGLLAMRRAEKGALLAVLDDVRSEWLEAIQLLQKSLPAGTPLLVTMRDVDLAITLDAEVVRLDVLPEPDAHDLLAARVKPKGILTPEATVKTLLQHLGYLPLAIRLAAGHVSKFARKPSFELVQFVEDVAQRAVSLLDAAGGAGLAASFAISYDGLSAEQQRLFRHCSVVSASLLTVEHMARLLSTAEEAVEPLLDDLVEVALLDWDREVKGQYVLHPLLRQYGYGLLRASEDSCAIHKQAAESLQSLATERPRTPAECLAEVDQWEMAEEWPQFAQRAYTLIDTIATAGYWKGIEDRLIRAQSTVQDLPHAQLYTARLLHARAVIALKQGRWQDSIGYGEQAIEIFRQLGDPHGFALACGNLGLAYTKIGEWPRAIELYQQDLEICEQLGDLHGVAQAYGNLGSIYYRQGNWTQAVDLYQRSRQLKERLQNVTGLAQNYNNLANIYADRGEYEQANDLYNQAARLYAQQNDQHGLAQAYGNLGSVCYRQGDYQQAITHFTQAEQIFSDLNDPHGLAMIYSNLGIIYLEQSEWAHANSYFAKDLSLSKQLGDIHGLGQTYGNLAALYARQGLHTKALEHYHQALQIFMSLGDLHGQANTCNNLGNFYAAHDVPQQALASYVQSIQLKHQIGDPHGIAVTHQNLGAFYLNEDNLPLGLYYLACASLSFAQSQAAHEVVRTNRTLATILGSAEAANLYLAQIEQNKLPDVGEQSGLTTAHLLTLVTNARQGDQTLGKRLFDTFQLQVVDPTLSAGDRALYRVLLRILVGINNLDLAGLPTETTKTLQEMLNHIQK